MSGSINLMWAFPWAHNWLFPLVTFAEGRTRSFSSFRSFSLIQEPKVVVLVHRIGCKLARTLDGSITNHSNLILVTLLGHRRRRRRRGQRKGTRRRRGDVFSNCHQGEQAKWMDEGVGDLPFRRRTTEHQSIGKKVE